jgi:hypothetical protein
LSCVTSVPGAADHYTGGNNGFAVYEFLSEVGESYLFLLPGANGDTDGVLNSESLSTRFLVMMYVKMQQ